jgi:uncharacterized membrane protein
MNAEEFLTAQEEKRIVEAIQQAEKNTSGEIRVHLESSIEKPSMQHAQEVFKLIGMQNTKEDNGVLFYVDVANNVFAVLGDKGIDNVVPDDFWDSVKNIVISAFKQQKYTDGLVAGILEVGNKLKQYFPYQADDVNELPDEISKNI